MSPKTAPKCVLDHLNFESEEGCHEDNECCHALVLENEILIVKRSHTQYDFLMRHSIH